MGQIFISYSRADKDFVDSLGRDIEAVEGSNFDVWTDRHDISGGEDWYAAISNAIRDCSSFLLVLSPKSAQSEKVAQELSIADKYDRRILPLMYQSCDIPPGFELPLARKQLIDFTQNYRQGMDSLCRALGNKQPATNYSEPQPASPSFPQPPPPQPLSLYQVLPGQWEASLTFGMMRIAASVWVGADGSFRAQQMPIGSNVQGRWSVDQANNVYLQGIETNGYVTAPYVGGCRVLAFDRNQINGIGSLGEQVYWRRVG